MPCVLRKGGAGCEFQGKLQQMSYMQSAREALISILLPRLHCSLSLCLANLSRSVMSWLTGDYCSLTPLIVDGLWYTFITHSSFSHCRNESVFKSAADWSTPSGTFRFCLPCAWCGPYSVRQPTRNKDNKSQRIASELFRFYALAPLTQEFSTVQIPKFGHRVSEKVRVIC